MITCMKTGITMAGAMTTTTEETAVELESGIHLETNKCSKDIVLQGHPRPFGLSWSGNVWLKLYRAVL